MLTPIIWSFRPQYFPEKVNQLIIDGFLYNLATSTSQTVELWTGKQSLLKYINSYLKFNLLAKVAFILSISSIVRPTHHPIEFVRDCSSICSLASEPHSEICHQHLVHISCEIYEFPAGNTRAPAGKITPCLVQYWIATWHSMYCKLLS